MVAVGKISIDMVAYTGKLLKPMKQAQSSVTKFTKHVKAMANTLKTVVLPLAGITAGVVTVGSAVALVKKQFGDIDEIAKEADRLGIATEQLTALQHAADLAGVSAEELTTALQYMLRQGKNVSDLGAIADEMAAMSDPAERMQLAVKMFGRGGAGMINVLEGGAKSLRNIIKDATLLGLTFSRLDAGKVEEANDAITRMKAGIAGMGRMAAIALSPMVTDIVNWVTEMEIAVIGFTDNWKKNWDMIKEWAPGFFDALAKNIENNWAVMVGNLVTDFIEGLKLIGQAMPLITQTLAKEMTSGGVMEWITRGLALPFGGEIWRVNEQLNPSVDAAEKLKKMLETWSKKEKHIAEVKLETIEELNLKS